MNKFVFLLLFLGSHLSLANDFNFNDFSTMNGAEFLNEMIRFSKNIEKKYAAPPSVNYDGSYDVMDSVKKVENYRKFRRFRKALEKILEQFILNSKEFQNWDDKKRIEAIQSKMHSFSEEKFFQKTLKERGAFFLIVAEILELRSQLARLALFEDVLNKVNVLISATQDILSREDCELHFRIMFSSRKFD